MTPRSPSPSSLNDMSLIGASPDQRNLMTAHRSGTCSSDSALHVPSSPQVSERSGDRDVVFIKPRRRISFDERVSVREYESNSWVSVKDMELSPVGSSGMRERPVITVPKFIVCSKDTDGFADDDLYPMLPGLQAGARSNKLLSLPRLLHREIRTILMIDPHDIFLSLFSKRLKEKLPHVQILTAHSSEEALQLLSKQAFDIIITEERLSLFHRHKSSNKLGSGSALLSFLRSSHHYSHQFHKALLIGACAHWQIDHATVEQSGVDYCWSKAPPPTLDTPLLQDMMHKLLLKRGKNELAQEFQMLTASGVSGAVQHHHGVVEQRQ